jgi:hypothetical protein
VTCSALENKNFHLGLLFIKHLQYELYKAGAGPDLLVNVLDPDHAKTTGSGSGYPKLLFETAKNGNTKKR